MILISGAGGFVGSHLTEALIKGGYEVRAMAEYNSMASYGWLDTIPNLDCEKVLGDVRDFDSVKACMEGCDTIIHAAALIDVAYSYKAPRSYIETNITGTVNTLTAARALGVEKFVHLSTSEIFGTAQADKMDELHPISAQSPYAASKAAADQFALSFYRSFGVPVSIARCFNVYGPRQSERAVISTIIKQALQDIPVKVGDIIPTRDFNFVSDTVAGIIAVLERGALGEVYNIGSGEDYSIQNIIEKINAIIGKPMRILVDGARIRPEKSEVKRLCCDASKAKRVLNWQSRVPINHGLELTVDWFRDPENTKHYRGIMPNEFTSEQLSSLNNLVKWAHDNDALPVEWGWYDDGFYFIRLSFLPPNRSKNPNIEQIIGGIKKHLFKKRKENAK